MTPYQHFIAIKGGRPEFGLLVFLEPCIEPFPQGELVRCNKRPLLLLPQCLGEFIGYFLTCFAGLFAMFEASTSH